MLRHPLAPYFPLLTFSTANTALDHIKIQQNLNLLGAGVAEILLLPLAAFVAPHHAQFGPLEAGKHRQFDAFTRRDGLRYGLLHGLVDRRFFEKFVVPQHVEILRRAAACRSI